MIKKRIQKLINRFDKYKIDGYVNPKNDGFFSEYSKNDRLKTISNFTGSAGSVSYTHLTLPTKRIV